jgi:DNA-binding transcriptional LysR family regulator
MELDHTETMKRTVMAGLGVAFVSHFAVADEIRDGRLRTIAVERLTIRRHFHVVHDERRPLSASARAFVRFLQEDGTAAATAKPVGAKRRRRVRRGG